MRDDRPVLVLDLHVHGPPFAGPRWFPPGTRFETRYIIQGETAQRPADWSAVVISGCSHSILDDHPFLAPLESFVRQAAELRAPMMGVCYGAQLLVRALLGREHVRRNPSGAEAGWLPVEVTDDPASWFEDLPRPFHTWHFHFDEVVNLPAGWRVLARSALCPIQAFEQPELNLLGVQFHPEFDLEEGNACFLKEADLLARQGLDAQALVAASRDDGASRLFQRFLER